MMAGYVDAINDMNTRLLDTVTSDASAVLGYVPNIEYEGVPTVDYSSLELVWLRSSVRQAVETQVANGSTEGAGTNTYQSIGTFIVQIFLPRSKSMNIYLGRQLAEIIRNSFRLPSPNDNVWFNDATVREVPPEKRWYQINVTVEYSFMQVI